MNEKGSSFIRKRVENHLIEHRKSMVFVHTSWSHPMIRYTVFVLLRALRKRSLGLSVLYRHGILESFYANKMNKAHICLQVVVDLFYSCL